MAKKIPIAGAELPLPAIIACLPLLVIKGKGQDKIKKEISFFLNNKYLWFLNSGLASFFIILESLKGDKNKNEVILPAYTAGSLVVAVKEAGLVPVLCDISRDDFNLDINLLAQIVTKKTLCITGVHMFGIAVQGLDSLKEKFPGVFIIEDCAQGMGSMIKGKSVGTLGDISFFSFNRGKNMPTYGGGCIATNDPAIEEKIEIAINSLLLKDIRIKDKITIALKILVLSLVVNPWVYGTLYPLISRFKEMAPPEGVTVGKYTDFQSEIARWFLRRIEQLRRKRYSNGMKLIEGLKDSKGIILPKIAQNTEPAFNRFPLLFEDLNRLERAQTALANAGIETSRMYFKPLHQMFDLGYKKEDFPQATYLAEHLLTLPVHPLVKESDIQKIIEILNQKC